MSEFTDRPGLPGYVSIKEAARMLGISDKRVYAYVEEGRLSSSWAADVIMIPREEVQRFQRKSAGRPRKTIPPWRISSGDNIQFVTFITVQVIPGQQEAFTEKLEQVRQEGQHTFPGTVARLIAQSRTMPGQVEISLIWRGMVVLSEIEKGQTINAFQQTFSNILDWDTACYYHSQVLMHT